MAKEMACDYIIPMDNEITSGVVVVEVELLVWVVNWEVAVDVCDATVSEIKTLLAAVLAKVGSFDLLCVVVALGGNVDCWDWDSTRPGAMNFDEAYGIILLKIHSY
jgi:hypothetical protein